MINPKELRIGNLILCNEKITEVLNIGVWDGGFGINMCHTGEHLYLFDEDKIEPIVLTEDLFLNIGFHLIENEHYEIQLGRKSFKIVPILNKAFVLLYQKDIGMNWNTINFVETLHMLQNVIFFISEKELNIKL